MWLVCGHVFSFESLTLKPWTQWQNVVPVTCFLCIPLWKFLVSCHPVSRNFRNKNAMWTTCRNQSKIKATRWFQFVAEWRCSEMIRPVYVRVCPSVARLFVYGQIYLSALLVWRQVQDKTSADIDMSMWHVLCVVLCKSWPLEPENSMTNCGPWHSFRVPVFKRRQYKAKHIVFPVLSSHIVTEQTHLGFLYCTLITAQGSCSWKQ